MKRRTGSHHRLSREERERLEGRRRLIPRLGPLPDLSGPVLRMVGGVAGVLLVVFVLSKLIGGSGGGGDLPAGPPDTAASAAWGERMEGAVRDAALGLGMRDDWVVVHEPGTPQGDSLLTVIEFKVPGDLHLEVLNLALTRAVQEAGGTIVQGVERHDARVELEAAYDGYRTHRLVLQRYSGYRRASGTIGLIIDDFGRTPAPVLSALIALPIPWTASIIPGDPRSAEEARRLTARGVPVMIHMPMEPEATEEWDLGDGAIMADTPSQDVDTLIARALDEIPQAKGMNNHMGSLATTRPAVMRAVMASLKARGFYFVDSMTTAGSVAGREAEQAGIPWTRRDLFVDPEDDARVIAAQLQLAVREAREKGHVVLIGHPRARTLEALKRWIPQAEDQGIQFVHVDRLLSRPGRQS